MLILVLLWHDSGNEAIKLGLNIFLLDFNTIMDLKNSIADKLSYFVERRHGMTQFT